MTTDYEIYSGMVEKLCEKPYNEANIEVRRQLCSIYDEFFSISGSGSIIKTHALVARLYHFALAHTGYNGVSDDLFDTLEAVYMYGKLVTLC